MLKNSLAIFLFLTLAACGQLAPFVDSRREAGQKEPVGQSAPGRIAVCSNGWWHDPEAIAALAQSACEKEGARKTAVFLERKPFSCRLLTPATSFFACRAPAPAAAK